MTTVVPSTVTSMYQLAVDLLGAVVAAMATTDGGAPDRSFVCLGPPAWETSCSQAAVQILNLAEGSTSPSSPPESTGRRYLSGRVNLVGLAAYSVRCIQSSQGNDQVYSAADDAQLSAEAKQGYEDGWAIWNWVTRAVRAGELFDGTCSIVHFDGGTPLEPAGGLGGWRFVMRCELGGYDPRGS